MRSNTLAPDPVAARRVVLLDADPESRQEALDLLRGLDFHATACPRVSAALDAAGDDPDLVVLASAREPTARSLELIEDFATHSPGTPVVVYADHSDVRVFRRLHQLRIADVVPWPPDREELRAAVAGARPRPAAPERTRSGEVISVIGAKGGVGKTTIATNLGALIAAAGDSVLLIDLDTRFGDCAALLDLTPSYTIVDLAPFADGDLKVGELEQALVAHECGLQVLAAPRHPREWRPITADQIATILAVARRRFDYIVIDTPGAFTDLLEAGIDRSETVLLVSSLERTSLKDTNHLLQLLEAEEMDTSGMRVVLDAVHRTDGAPVSEAARVVGRHPQMVIPYDEKVVHANSAGRPVVLASPSTAASRELRRLGASLVRELAEQPGAGFRAAFMRRLKAPAAPLRRSA